VGTDTMIAAGMLDRVRALCPDDLDIRILPIQAVGKSNEHLHAPGTLTLSAQTALAAWQEIGLSVARAGVRKIVIVNSHGGNLDLVSILSRELAGAGGDAGGEVPVGQLRPSRGDVSARGTRLRHPRRRCGDLAHARLPARLRGHGPAREQPLVGRDGADLRPSAPSPMAGCRATSTRSARSATPRSRRPKRARRRRRIRWRGFIGLLRKVAAMPLDGLAPTQPAF
jgi:creatinine amidohydrolase